MYRITTSIALITLLIGIGIGYTLPNTTTIKKSLSHKNHDQHDTHSHSEDIHNHDQKEASKPYPSVDLTVHKDPQGGWNAHISVDNFTFTPNNVNKKDVPGEGHAHIYVNGKKVNRVYGEWYHLNELKPGIHDISVRLSSNDHKELTQNGEVISDVEIIRISNK